MCQQIRDKKKEEIDGDTAGSNFDKLFWGTEENKKVEAWEILVYTQGKHAVS